MDSRQEKRHDRDRWICPLLTRPRAFHTVFTRIPDTGKLPKYPTLMNFCALVFFPFSIPSTCKVLTLILVTYILSSSRAGYLLFVSFFLLCTSSFIPYSLVWRIKLSAQISHRRGYATERIRNGDRDALSPPRCRDDCFDATRAWLVKSL